MLPATLPDSLTQLDVSADIFSAGRHLHEKVGDILTPEQYREVCTPNGKLLHMLTSLFVTPSCSILWSLQVLLRPEVQSFL